jgi:sulfur carrier protein ThiS
MTVKLVYRNQTYEVPAGMTVRDAIKKVGLQPETVLAVYGGRLITDDTILKEEMKQIKLVAVISGGVSPLPARERGRE